MEGNGVKRVLILWPRLDVTFKPGPVPEVVAPISSLPPIRQYWADFLRLVTVEHERAGHEVEVWHRPLWLFNPDEVIANKPDVVYVPHKCHFNFPAKAPGIDVRYYMQTVYPWMFTVDPLGWGAALSTKPDHKELRNGAVAGSGTSIFHAIASQKISKFDQPHGKEVPWSNYSLFVCQIPHDEVIKYFSKITVEKALQGAIEWATETGRILVVKGHPVNQASQQALRTIVDKASRGWAENIYWTCDEYNIHDLLNQCARVLLVNSGVGIEAMVHGKPIISFGESEYQHVVSMAKDAKVESIHIAASSSLHEVERYDTWLDNFYHMAYDTKNPTSFLKLVSD